MRTPSPDRRNAAFSASGFPKLFSLLWLSLLVVLYCAAPDSGEAQVLVYKMEISEGDGINYYTYDGGYFVAPLLGGTGSFLLTSSDGPRWYVEAVDSGRMFSALRDDDKMTVVSASTRSETASGAMLAYGRVDHKLQVTTPTAELRVLVARQLNGTSLSCDDESGLTQPTLDGSLGVAGISRLKLRLDEEETRSANKAGRTIPQTMDQLKLELERAGYGHADQEDENEDPVNDESEFEDAFPSGED